MARNTTTRSERKVRKERKLRRRLLLVVLGVVLGGAAVLFFSTIYNPFGGTVDSPLVLVPDDMDFVVSIPDFPEFVGKVRDQQFVESLDRHPGFQGFLKTPFARRTGIIDALRGVFRELDDVAGRLPLGLDLYGDVSGRQVIVAGYLPEDDEPIRFMAVFQPGSWKTVAGVNVLLSETLFGWIPDDWVGDGLEVEHRRDQVKLRVEGLEQDLWVTRIADTVIVSTEERQLARIRNAVHKSGLPEAPAPRYMRLEQMTGASSQVHVLARRKRSDAYLGIEERLLDLWGPEDLDLAESTLPRLGGEDVVAELHVAEGVGLAVGGQTGALKKGDISQILQPFGRDDLEDAVRTLDRFLPADVFGLVHLNVPLGRLANTLFERDDLFSFEERKLWDDWIETTPVFSSRAGMFDTLTGFTGERMSLVFFTQPRDALPDAAKSGYALVARVRNEPGLLDLLARLEREIAHSGGDGGVRQIYREKVDGVELFKPVLRAGAVDNPDVTVPGLAIADGHLLITNYFPWLREIPEVLADKRPSLASNRGFETALSYAPDDLLIAGMVDGTALQPYLDQSVPGWVHKRTSPTNDDFMQWLREGREDGRKRGIPPGPGLEAHADRYRDQQQRRFVARRPELARDFRMHLDYFRSLVDAAGFFVENVGGGMRVQLRIDPKAPPR